MTGTNLINLLSLKSQNNKNKSCQKKTKHAKSDDCGIKRFLSIYMSTLSVKTAIHIGIEKYDQ